jgi:hypothetical protein
MANRFAIRNKLSHPISQEGGESVTLLDKEILEPVNEKTRNSVSSKLKDTDPGKYLGFLLETKNILFY